MNYMQEALELLHEIIIQLQEAKGQAERKISTLTIDTLFSKLQQEFKDHMKGEEEVQQYGTTHKIISKALLQQTEIRLNELRMIKDLNDHQFYQYLRLKKISAGISQLLKCYDEIPHITS
jgi:hypothetical protein